MVLVTSAVLMLCQFQAKQVRAQAILPLAVEQLAQQGEGVESPPPFGISNFNDRLAALWKADFSVNPGQEKASPTAAESDSGDDPAEKRKSTALPDPAIAPADMHFPQLKDGRWGNRGEFNWNGAFKQSFLFLGVQHAFRLATEEGTRAELKGPFFKDYFKALRGLRGWGDGDPFIVNYIGHPMMGAVSGYIQIQNDPKGIEEEIGLKKSYWKSRMKAMGWSFFYSTQFELGLVSEASLGNIGIRPTKKAQHPMAYVDLVVTPVVGTGWLVSEDALDKYIIRRYEDRMPNRATRILFRSFLNPTRSFANIMRGKWPWFRDNRK